MPLFTALKLGREARALRSRYPEPWRMGETLAEDRMSFFPAGGEVLLPEQIGPYVQRAASEAVALAAHFAAQQGPPSPRTC